MRRHENHFSSWFHDSSSAITGHARGRKRYDGEAAPEGGRKDATKRYWRRSYGRRTTQECPADSARFERRVDDRNLKVLVSPHPLRSSSSPSLRPLLPSLDTLYCLFRIFWPGPSVSTSGFSPAGYRRA